MNPAMQGERSLTNRDDDVNPLPPAEMLPIRTVTPEQASLSENFHNDIDVWARHALARNGFADALIYTN